MRRNCALNGRGQPGGVHPHLNVVTFPGSFGEAMTTPTSLGWITLPNSHCVDQGGDDIPSEGVSFGDGVSSGRENSVGDADTVVQQQVTAPDRHLVVDVPRDSSGGNGDARMDEIAL